MRVLQGLAMAVAMTISAGGGALAQEAAADTPATPALPVASATVAAAAMSEVQAQVPVSGTLVARNEVLIYPQVSGFEVTEILAEAGDQVSAGAVLARLSADTLRAQAAQAEAEYQRATAGVAQARSQIEAAEASLTQASSTLERTRALSRSGTASRALLDQAVAAEANARAGAQSAGDGLAVAEAALAQATAARDLARLNLSHTEITAPLSGMIAARDAQQGAIASAAGLPMFRLIAGGEIELEAEVIETALPQLRQGAPAVLRVAGVGNGVGAVTGQVRLVPATVDPVTRLGKLRIALSPTEGLRTGLFAAGQVITQQREAITVPATAVLEDGTESIVQVVSDGHVQTRLVTAGLIWKGRREIRDGLAEGEEVIARSGAFFRDGDAVNPVRDMDAAP